MSVAERPRVGVPFAPAFVLGALVGVVIWQALA